MICSEVNVRYICQGTFDEIGMKTQVGCNGCVLFLSDSSVGWDSIIANT